jgi:hypothetical protein
MRIFVSQRVIDFGPPLAGCYGCPMRTPAATSCDGNTGDHRIGSVLNKLVRFNQRAGIGDCWISVARPAAKSV